MGTSNPHPTHTTHTQTELPSYEMGMLWEVGGGLGVPTGASSDNTGALGQHRRVRTALGLLCNGNEAIPNDLRNRHSTPAIASGRSPEPVPKRGPVHSAIVSGVSKINKNPQISFSPIVSGLKNLEQNVQKRQNSRRGMTQRGSKNGTLPSSSEAIYHRCKTLVFSSPP